MELGGSTHYLRGNEIWWLKNRVNAQQIVQLYCDPCEQTFLVGAGGKEEKA